jgi:hypothetical protein
MSAIVKIAGLALAAAALAGCQTTGRQADGQRYAVPADHAEVIRAYLRETLKDPYSVRSAEISGPAPVFVGLVYGGTRQGICVRYNAKNSFGAYVGIEEEGYVFLDGAVWRRMPTMFGSCAGAVWRPFPALENMS